ncbi:hypothetical protein BJ742DRAFT_685628 [Cladochytrium replicatum]|nr:hypothetical protein BJ742DRAFT_685628 [Cladochytrium replicatum]
MIKTPTALKLTYFPIEALGEPIRLAFFIGGIEFEDERVHWNDFGSIRGSLPFGQLPILTIDNKTVLCQARTSPSPILRYAGRLANLYPSDPLEAALVDQVTFGAQEIPEAIRNTMSVYDKEQKRAVREALVANGPPAGIVLRTFGHLDGLLGQTSGTFSVGDKLTIADLFVFNMVAEFMTGHWDMVPESARIPQPFANVMKVYQNVKSHPKVVEWYKIQQKER